MTTAVVCTALLGLLVFGLGFAVSATRGATGVNIGYTSDPTDRLYKLVRAHGNATEYVPMMAVLIVLVGMHQPSAWMRWTFIAATVVRYCHAAGMILSPTLDKPYPLRFIGAVGTYIVGFALVIATLSIA